jgi:hypothetical protein
MGKTDLRKNNTMKNLLFLVAVCFIFTQCHEAKKGCLETEAVNFDATADDTCCCIYPKLILTVDQNYDTLVYVKTGLYPRDNNQFFRINNIVFYLSEFSFDKNGTNFPITDSYEFKLLPDSIKQRLINDFTLIRRSPADFTVGTLRESGTFGAFHFSIGLNDAALKIKPSSTPAQHPLRQQSELLWLGNDLGYAAAKIEFVRDSMLATKPDTIYLSQPEFQKIALDFVGDYKHQSGYNFKIKLKVDYKTWFEGVNLPTDDIPTIKSKIIANLPRSFDVSQ